MVGVYVGKELRYLRCALQMMTTIDYDEADHEATLQGGEGTIVEPEAGDGPGDGQGGEGQAQAQPQEAAAEQPEPQQM